VLTAADAPLCSLSLASADSLPKLEVSISSSAAVTLFVVSSAFCNKVSIINTITGTVERREDQELLGNALGCGFSRQLIISAHHLGKSGLR
jgi:hypothetical protein